ncbi:MAG: type II toxin-antitoxin system Phd/YefM family antitoxin [Geminicoccaceae bacterium]
MSEFVTITAREANHRFSELLSKVESEGRGFVVTKHGRPVARIVPFEAGSRRIDPDKEAAMERLFASAKPLGVGRISRDELHERS